MIVITGKSGVGKTSILKKVNHSNIFFADTFVKDVLYKEGHEVFKDIIKKYPTTKTGSKINTKELGKLILNDKEALNKISKLIEPYIKVWLDSLPTNSIVEMAAYINYEKIYSEYFDKVILITRKTEDLSKFSYLSNVNQPIDDKEIKYDYLIENINIEESAKTLANILNSLY